MSFIWPTALLLLFAIPLILWFYIRLDRRRVGEKAEAPKLGRGPQTTRNIGKRRHVPPVLAVVALSVLFVGFARPQATVDVPQRTSTVVLAFDTSSSMLADDLEPTRLDAAKAAATSFVEEQPNGVNVAVVSFGTGGAVTSRPTDDRVATLAAIDRLQPEGGTSLTQGVFAALSTLANEPIMFDGETIPEVDFGGFGSRLIVVFSDGEDTSEQDPEPLVELAARAGIRIITIGIGTEEGAVIELDGFSLATTLNPESLQALSDATNGEYIEAANADELNAATENLERDLELVPEELELTGVAGAIALALAALAGVLSLVWTGRLP